MSRPFEAFLREDGLFQPLDRYQNMVGADHAVGEVVTLVREEARSQASHNHYFAALNDAWLNLPEGEAERFPSVERLRKWALIRAGYRDERTIVCASKAEAQRMAAFMAPLDEYAIIVPREATVTAWTAKSQSLKAMGKADFQASKDAVLEIVGGMIGVTADALAKNARTVAA